MEVFNIQEIYVTAYELSKITGKQLPKIIIEIKSQKIEAIVSKDNGIKIPLSQFFPSSWDYLR